MSQNYTLLDKSKLKSITINDIVQVLPDLKNGFEAKSLMIANWLIGWIETNLKTGNIKPAQLLPKKAEFAYALGVSIGTMQNALRYVEDRGCVESKQCIGTMIRDWTKPIMIRKLTSKKDVSMELIKKYILEKQLKIAQKLPSSRILANVIGTSANTTRLALEALCSVGILEHADRGSNETIWVVKNNKFALSDKIVAKDSKTLVSKVEKDLENYIILNLKVGDRMPAHSDLSEKLKVSVKTIHDGLKRLIKNGTLLARRGRYGTIVLKMPNEMTVSPRKETSIFASAQATAFYNYEKTQEHIKKLIAENYEVGDRLPSIMDLSAKLDLSSNTVRKAFENLAKEGYLRFARGRYGGTFVIDVPEIESAQSFKWLAVNPKYSKVY